MVDVTRDVLGLESPAAVDGREPAAAQSEGATKPGQEPTNDADANVDAAAPAEGSNAVGRGPTATATAPAAARAGAKPNPRPCHAGEIGPGSLVLATTGAAEGWYEARVIGVNGSAFTLKWVDYAEPNIVRRGNELGFLPRLSA